MQNKLIDLNNHLFAQLERLSDEDVTGEELQQEINRSKAISSISKNIVDNATLQLDAVKLQAEHGRTITKGIPQELLGNKDD